MLKKVAVAFSTLALAVASAAGSHRISLFQPVQVNGHELKPGEYRLELKQDKAVLTSGKQSVEVPVKIEDSGEKYRSTTIRYSNTNGQLKVQEIRIGGTSTKLVVADQSAALR